MPEIAYITKRFSDSSLAIIAKANEICAEYAGQGFDLTLRQLYYQFVARDLIANRQTEYKRLGSIINDARLAGVLDWSYIVDRTRNLVANSHWSSPSSIIDSVAFSYRNDLWANQPYRPEVWIEKDALLGVIEGVSQDNDVPYFSCRGYTSQSETWRAGRRMRRYIQGGQIPLIIHLGDHDPSGIDMSRDIYERLRLFAYEFGDKVTPEVRRIALNMDQVDQYGPPPNPTKLTDSRAQGYIADYGYDSWELDALEPSVLSALIQDEIDSVRDLVIWEEDKAKQEDDRQLLQRVSDNWTKVVQTFEEEE